MIIVDVVCFHLRSPENREILIMAAVPESLACLLDLVDEDIVLAFIEGAQGQRISVPKKAEGSRLAAVYGLEIARALCRTWGGDKYIVPSCRWWRAKKHADSGMAVSDIAARLGIVRGSVYELLNRSDTKLLASRRPWQDDRQISLF